MTKVDRDHAERVIADAVKKFLADIEERPPASDVSESVTLTLIASIDEWKPRKTVDEFGDVVGVEFSEPGEEKQHSRYLNLMVSHSRIENF